MNILKIHPQCFSIVKQFIIATALIFSTPSFAQQAPNQHQHPATTTETPVQQQPTTTDTADTSTSAIPTETEEDIAIAPTPDNIIAADETAFSHDLSPWGMYLNADIVVKAVMIGLLLASILTWTIFVAKLAELLMAKKRLRQEMARLRSTKTLPEAIKTANNFAKNSLATILVNDAQEEIELSADTTTDEGIKERAAFRQDRLVAASGRQMNTGTGILATIGSVSPFVGLFGTVWGIMNSFIGIAKSQTTNLAVVAPGIAEALLATAMGLVAAIPAVIIYNVFVRSISHYRVLISDISAHTLLLLSRDLDRKKVTTPLAAAPRSTVTKIG